MTKTELTQLLKEEHDIVNKTISLYNNKEIIKEKTKRALQRIDDELEILSSSYEKVHNEVINIVNSIDDNSLNS